MLIVVEEVLALKLRMEMTQKWDERFLQVAQLISTWSKDPSTKNGAIAVSSNRRILSQGYNGFPSEAKDDERLNNRKSKYPMVIHAESNIIYNACNFGISLNLSTVYLFGTYPCPECIKALGQVGIGRLVFQLGPSSNKKKWEWDFNLSKAILHELGIGFTHYQNNNPDIPTSIERIEIDSIKGKYNLK